ncbi:MAG: hypothetical protein ACFB4I_22265 [Cyanophyceae cyanobacterium]
MTPISRSGSIKNLHPHTSPLAIAAALLSSTAMGLTPTTVQAAILAYEGFDYEPTTQENSLLNGLPGEAGLNGGTGWLPYKNEQPSATHFNTTGLSYRDDAGDRLLTSGRSGALTNAVGEHGSFRFINTANSEFTIPTIAAREPNLGDAGSQTQPGLGVDGTTLWLGFLMSVPGLEPQAWNEKYAGLSLFYDDYINGRGTGPFPTSGTNERLFLGAPFGQPDRPLNIGLDHPGAASPIFTATPFAGETTFLTARIDFGSGASDRVRLWVNPTLESDPSTTVTPDMDYLMPFELQFNRIGIFGNSPFTDPEAIEFDEIRVGTSFQDIAPTSVPEPALGGLAIALLPALFKWCRKQKG